jgi:putative component of toxin-antitoxin plasmid stabilization module
MFEVRRTDRFDKWLKGLADKKGKALISDRIERVA